MESRNPIDVRERRERWVRGEKGKWRKMWFIRCTPLRRVSWMNIRLALLRDRERVDAGKDAPKCVGASLSLRIERYECGLPKMRRSFTRFVLTSGTASAGTEFRNCAPGRWGLGLQLVGRMREWSWLAAAGPVKCGLA